MTDNLPATQSGRDVAISEELLGLLAEEKTDDFKAGDTIVPWLQLVQTSGGYMKRNNPNYNEAAREGDITDNLSRRLRSTQAVILVRFEEHYTTWEPNGGKLLRQHFTDASAYNAAQFPEGKNYGSKFDHEGNEVRPSKVYYVLAVDPESGVFTPMVWSLSSTQAGKARRINSLAREMMIGPGGKPFVPPIYARLFDLGSVIETGGPTGDKSWAGWTFEVGGAVLAHKHGRLWHEAAVAFRKEILAGNVRPAAEDDNAGGAPRSSEDAEYEPAQDEPRQARDAANSTDDIPF